MMYYKADAPTVHGISSAKLEMVRGGELTIVSGNNVVRVTAHPNGTLNIVDQKTGQALNLQGK